MPVFGLPSKFCIWVSRFLANQSIFGVFDGQSSNVTPINAGVPYGSVLAPILFVDQPTTHYPARLTQFTAMLILAPCMLPCSLQSLFQLASWITSAKLRQSLSRTNSDWGDSNLAKFNESQNIVYSPSRTSHPLTLFCLVCKILISLICWLSLLQLQHSIKILSSVIISSPQRNQLPKNYVLFLELAINFSLLTFLVSTSFLPILLLYLGYISSNNFFVIGV